MEGLKEELKRNVSSSLLNSARSYYKVGLIEVFKSKTNDWRNFQPAIGNLSISVELLLKYLVAQKSIRYLYQNIPLEAQILLTDPNCLPGNHRPYYIDNIKWFSKKTIELQKAIELFNIYFPDKKNEFNSFFSSIPDIRNVCVHAAIPRFKKFELDRITYFTIKLFRYVGKIDKKAIVHLTKILEGKIVEFIDSYEETTIKIVKDKIKNAQSIAANRNFEKIYSTCEGWEEMLQICPVCNEEGICLGNTNPLFDDDGGTMLIFEASSFQCFSCKLELDSYEEMVFADMDIELPRDEGEEEDWVRQNEDYFMS
mgnify:CR=1 FL=1|jgi:hypothetical protein